MKKSIPSLLIAVIFLVIIGFIFHTTTTRSPEKKETTKTSPQPQAKIAGKETAKKEITTPTLFIHGYSGGKSSFGPMIDRFSSKNLGSRSLVITVKPDGNLAIQGTFDKYAKNPLIQLLFADNKSSMVNQSEWIKDAMIDLKNVYHIEEVNLVGHSMGGVSLTDYIEKNATNKSVPSVKKVALLGAPLNGLSIGDDGKTPYDLTPTGPAMQSERYAELLKNSSVISNKLEVLNVAGDTKDGRKSDGSVSIASALSGKFIYKRAASYKEKIITGKEGKHSNLHDSEKVDKWIADFLWD